MKEVSFTHDMSKIAEKRGRFSWAISCLCVTLDGTTISENITDNHNTQFRPSSVKTKAKIGIVWGKTNCQLTFSFSLFSWPKGENLIRFPHHCLERCVRTSPAVILSVTVPCGFAAAQSCDSHPPAAKSHWMPQLKEGIFSSKLQQESAMKLLECGCALKYSNHLWPALGYLQSRLQGSHLHDKFFRQP